MTGWPEIPGEQQFPHRTPRRSGARSRLATLAAAATALSLAVGLAGCAPEPGDASDTSTSDAVAGAPEKGSDTESDGSSWGETSDIDDPALKQTELPEGFPSDAFALPAGAVIDDAGQRDTTWFVVLRAADAAEADVWWTEIIETNGLTASDEQETSDGGRSATLTSTTLVASALRLPDAGTDGVLLSYDLTLSSV